MVSFLEEILMELSKPLVLPGETLRLVLQAETKLWIIASRKILVAQDDPPSV
jgi:hypothetical protein